jgi:hypothetical protein
MERSRIIAQQFRIQHFWSCGLQKMLRADKKLKDFYDSVVVPPRIRLRDSALKGGRVECFKMYHRCKAGEEIIYIDIVSVTF